MGCDIHAHVEVKINGKWEHYNAPYIGRDYELFGNLAGVRRLTTPVVPPRGFPDDASEVTALDFRRWGVDAHTPSWLTRDEVLKVPAWNTRDRELGYLFGNGWERFEDDEDPFEDARLVFWFDN